MTLPVNEIICGDCITEMAKFPPDTFDGIVTDPPYGLEFMGKEWDKFGNVKTYGRTTQGYKNRQFKHPTGKVLKTGINSPAAVAGDYDHSLKAHLQFQQWFTIWATEALRIVKPGAIMLIFGGTRTYHRLACAVEDAGWQIRDNIANFIGSDWKLQTFYESLNNEQKGAFEELFLPANVLAWNYGSGFPKSANISLMFDKRACLEQLTAKLGRKPTKEELKKAWEGFRKQTGTRLDGCGANAFSPKAGWHQHSMGKEVKITEPNTDLAKLWDGYGTALKPAWEPIIVAMKPLDGTFAQNAEKWGVAGLNIDGGRIGLDGEKQPTGSGKPCPDGNADMMSRALGNEGNQTPTQGRWPANVILDEEAAAMLDEQSGELKTGAVKTQVNHGANQPINLGGGLTKQRISNSGGASRFFYCAKASRAERNAGLEGMEAKLASSMPGRRNADDMSQSKTDHDVTSRFCTTKQNNHPTVKPLKLMEYLCRLLKPPGGHPILLDPFAGSGTTLMAAVNTGWDYVGIEKEPDYVEIARRRVAWLKKQEIGQLGLF